MAPGRAKNKEYYAVIRGRIDEPTIFSSWGDAHPRVTGCNAKHRSFFTLDAAREYMKKHGITAPKELVKAAAGTTTPLPNSQAFYAVANGTEPGIFPVWCGETGAQLREKGVSDCCHKRFRTRNQAEAFIKDWQESYADACRWELRQALKQGGRFEPRSMKVNAPKLYEKAQADDEGDGVSGCLIELEKLEI